MDYDYLKVKDYECRVEKERNGESRYILSFTDRKHLKVSHQAKEIMDFFDGENTLKQILNNLNSKGANITEKDLRQFVDQYMRSTFVLEGMEIETDKNKSYLWIHIPIIDSARLSPLFHVLKLLYSKFLSPVLLLLVAVCIASSIFFLKEASFSTQDINSLALLLLGYLSLIFHEFGHISAAYRKKIQVGKIGIGMYLFNPVMYVDLTNAWRLNYKDRMVIDAGGMYFQLLTIIPVTLTAFLFDQQFLYAVSLYILAMTLINLTPFVKLDGYWILCDYLKVNNLSNRAHSIGKKAIKNLLHPSREKSEWKEIRPYLFFSIVHLVSTAILIIFGIVFAFEALSNWNQIQKDIHSIYQSLIAADFQNALSLLNQTFVFILPLLFLLIMIIKIFKTLYGKARKSIFTNRIER